MGIKCFWIEPTGTCALYLRRYVSREMAQCPANSFHNESVRIEDAPYETDAEGYGVGVALEPFLDDKRWPLRCSCGYEFGEADERQIFIDQLYRRADTGETFPLRDAPPGAMYDAWWAAKFWTGPDGRSLIVKLPNGMDWQIDGCANNCTMKDDPFQKQHHCWVRHGEPPNITVGKDGVTCAAGSGSILSGDYHGFLVNGVFEP